MRDEFCEKLAALALASLTAGTALTTGAFGVAAFATALTLPAVWSRYCNWAECAEKRAFKTAAKETRAVFDALIAGGEFKSDERIPAETALAGVVEKLSINPDAMKAAKWNEALLINAVMTSAELVAAHDYAPGHDVQKNANRRLLELQWQATLKSLKALPDFEAKVMPAFRRDVMEVLADIKTDTAATRKQQAIDTIKLDEVLALLRASPNVQSAKAEGVSEATIVAIARKYSANVDSIEQALAEIENAIRIAVEVRGEAKRGRNFHDETNEVLKRLAELTDKGRLQEASETADAEIANWEEEQQRHQAKGLALLSAGVRQDTLNNDAKGVAAKLMRQMELETPNNAERFEALRSIQDNWYVRGRDKGISFDLEVSTNLAKASQGIATNADQRGFALNDLGVALATLGASESGTENLIASVAAFRAALEEYARDRVPLDWAKTQNNLGNTLAALGKRESGTKNLISAVAAYRAALEEWTRDRVPLDWATAQNNLGAALQTLGSRESGTENLMAAVTAYRAALEEQPRDRVPLDWAATQNNLGNALQTLGARESGTESLLAAVAAFRAALDEWTRERVPRNWATAQNNFGNALQTLGSRESGTENLIAAVEAYRKALKERTRDRVPMNWATTQRHMANCEWAFAIHAATTDPMPHCQKALLHIDAALEVFSPHDSDFYHEEALRSRVSILGAIAKLEHGSASPS